MKRFVAVITCVALLPAAAWAQQPEPAPQLPPEAQPQQPPPEAQPQQPSPANPQLPPPAYQQQPPQYAYPPPQYAPRPEASLGPEWVYRSGRRQRAIGMLMTFMGIGLGALGAALIYDAKNHDSTTFDDSFEKTYGIFFTLMGGGCLIPGVILWINGALKMDDARQLGTRDLSLAPTPRVAIAPGLTWTYRF